MNRGMVQIPITPARATSQMPWWAVEGGGSAHGVSTIAWSTGLITSSQHFKCNLGDFRSLMLWLGAQRRFAALQHLLHQDAAHER